MKVRCRESDDDVVVLCWCRDEDECWVLFMNGQMPPLSQEFLSMRTIIKERKLSHPQNRKLQAFPFIPYRPALPLLQVSTARES